MNDSVNAKINGRVTIGEKKEYDQFSGLADLLAQLIEKYYDDMNLDDLPDPIRDERLVDSREGVLVAKNGKV